MKSVILITLLAVTLAHPSFFQNLKDFSDPLQDCLKLQCSSTYNACAAEIFGCLPKATACANKCSSDADCLVSCAASSGNKKLIALADCGSVNCRTLLAAQDCDFVGCFQSFISSCTDLATAVECAQNFWVENPQCQCILG